MHKMIQVKISQPSKSFKTIFPTKAYLGCKQALAQSGMSFQSNKIFLIINKIVLKFTYRAKNIFLNAQHERITLKIMNFLICILVSILPGNSGWLLCQIKNKQVPICKNIASKLFLLIRTHKAQVHTQTVDGKFEQESLTS